MTNFLESFAQGQKAAELAIHAKQEISNILDSLARDVLSATQGKLQIGVMVDKNIGNAVVAMINVFGEYERAEPNYCIYAKNVTTESAFVRLAKWVPSSRGYPCTLIYDGSEHRCHDRESLERILSEMLENPSIGTKLRALLNQEAEDENTVVDSGNDSGT